MYGERELDERRSALSEDKRALLRERLQGRARGAATAQSQTIPRRARGAIETLSFAQQRLWFLDQLVPGSPFYTESSASRIKAPLSVPAFQSALNEIVRRHEVLRTTFSLVGDQPAAIVSAKLHIPVEVMDLTGLPEAECEAEVVRLATAEARRAFDLRRGPLLRTTLLRLGSAAWIFLLSMHHIVCDAWSSSVFSRELSEIYFAFVAGQPSPLAELPIQYADFAHWQRAYLSDGLLNSQLNYWREQLAYLPQLELPADLPRPPAFSYLGAHHKFILPRSLATELKRWGQRHGATLFMTLLGGFNTLLHRYTSQSDLAVGVPVANRNRRELESLIGFFVNVLVMRNDLSGNPTHREVLERIRATALDAYAHQDLPFEKLVEDLHPERDLARNPLFQVIFQLHENPAGGQPGARSALTLVEVDRATVKFDLRVDFFQEAEELLCVIEYSTDLFTADRIERMGQHLRTIYQAMVGYEEQRIEDFALVDDAEKAILARWGAVQETEPLNATIHERFAEQVELTPDAVAVVAADRTVTYSELNALADAFACELRERDIRLDELVAVPSEPGLEVVVALIGILKAGGAYLPINSSYPDERLHFMLRDSGARLLIDVGVESEKYSGLGLEVVKLDLSLARSGEAPAKPSPATPDNLAYAMYTSGSTGIPKGICITHRSVLRLVTEANFCSMKSGETFLLLAPLTFDASTLEIWAPLLNGGRLIIYPEKRVSPDDLRRSIAGNGVSTLWLTAGLFHEIVDNHPETLAGVRQLLAGGDVLSARRVRAQLAKYPECKVINGYGPTENTTFTCCHVMTDSSNVVENVPIGQPVTRTHVYVVDRYNQLAPIGMPGELCTGGDGLARCYLNDPALTAERFVPDPFSETPQRMYRTGDLVSFLPNGELRFLGRVDRQLKIRGFRVEPGEIETALLQHAAVQNAAVLALDGPNGEKRLTAFVVPRPPDLDDDAQATWRNAEDTLLDNWKTLYDDLYEKRNGADASFDIVGWKASDTGEPIPAPEMREWLDATVNRIKQSDPQSLLEIGCGTGLLSYRLAPAARKYVGIDFSSAVIERLKTGLQKVGLESPRVSLRAQSADDFSGIERHAFAGVVLNSIVQYFPSADYLVRVLENAVASTAPGGSVFLGDVRSLPHLAPFHARVQLARAEPELPRADFLQRIEKAMQLERELLIDPGFFEALSQQIPRITHVDVQWKRGSASNELNSYRYDVVLHVDAPHRPPAGTRELDWVRDDLCIEKLRQLLLNAKEDLVVVRGASNSRVYDDVQLWRRIKQNDDGLQTVAELRSSDAAEGSALPPLDEFWKVADGTKYVAHLRSEGDEALEACLIRYVKQSENGFQPLGWQLPSTALRPWADYANQPLKLMVAEQLTPGLRKHLEELLPNYMLPSAFVVVESLALTRNGKVDQEALLRLSQERSSVTAGYVAARDDIERRLAEVWTRVLGIERVGIHDNFFELGGDSILCIQVISKANAAGIHLTVKQIFENQTIAKLAAVATSAPSVHADQGEITGPSRFTPPQAWLLEQNLIGVNHFNQSILLEIPRSLNPAILDRSLRALVRHHDALRLRCERRNDQGEWRAFYAAPHDSPILEQSNVSGIAVSRKTAELERQCAAVQAGLDITSGPVFRAVLYDLGSSQSARLLLATHHLVVDGVSWRVLLEDLWTVYSELAAGQEPAFPAKTTSLHFWAQRLAEFANSDQLQSEMDFWLAVPPEQLPRLPVDHEGNESENTVGSVCIVREELSADETQAILSEVPKAFRTQVNDILLTALAGTLSRWTANPVAYFDLEGHGREPLFDDVDLSRTVGWFTSIFPVRLETDSTAGVVSTVQSVRAQLAAIPNRGVGFGVLRFLAEDAEVRARLRALPKRELSFNYLGQFGGGNGSIRGATESAGPMRDPKAAREYLIEIDGSVAQNCLTFNWSYSEAFHDRSTVEQLARQLMDNLRLVIERCRHGEQAPVTPADFPEANLDQEDLNRLLRKLQQLNGNNE
jgi:amino acid adenylation domain-containing protein/non-ribosomal peptide synthase protein (TIGR01720 family)